VQTATLLLHCQDTKGIVYRVSELIFRHGGNIIHAQQHKEELDNQFFMRVHFDTHEMTVSPEEFEKLLEAFAEEFSMHFSLHFDPPHKKLAILVSKYDHCLYDLLLRHQYGEIQADIAFIASNHPDLERVAGQFSIPFHHIPVDKEKREVVEEALLGHCKGASVNFIVLARYMQILTPLLVNAYRNAIINVHHGFLPAFQGARPYHQAYERGVKLIGATSHFVTEELDEGPIIAQETVHVNHGHSVNNLVSMGRDIEKRVLADAVKAHAENRIMVYKNRTIVFEG
jgi:formyltetrahydrofolate deformylase